MHIEIGIEKFHHESYMAIKFIKKFLVKNNIDRVIKVKYDFDCGEGGYYYPLMNNDTIFVNPDNCYNLREYNEEDDRPQNTFYPGYCVDNTIFGTIIHEFSHFLSYKVYKNIIKDYKKTFPKNRLYLNAYSSTDIEEELANIMTLYISNPYLLKLISEKHYKFLKKIFKPPRACSVKTCYQIYKNFPMHVKNELKDKWHIIYNFDKQKFERVEPKDDKTEH